MKIKYLGHSALQIDTKGMKVIVDPFITPNPKAGVIDLNSLAADAILLTHGHADHVADAATIAERTKAPIIAAYEIVEWFGKQGHQGHPMNHGGMVKFDFGTVKMVNAVHSSVLPDGTYGGNPAGFVLWNEEGCIYIAGDTALTLDMQLIPMTCPKIDLAIFPIGDNFTMGYADAVIAADFVESDRILGCHYDTFPYIEIDHAAAAKAFTDVDKTLYLPQIGEEVEV